MDIIGSFLGAGESALTGGLFGLVGNIATKVFGYFEAKQAFVQKQAEWGHESELLKLQMQAKSAETEQEIHVAESQGSWSGLSASLTAQGAHDATSHLAHAIRALVLPRRHLGLTTYIPSA